MTHCVLLPCVCRQGQFQITTTGVPLATPGNTGLACQLLVASAPCIGAEAAALSRRPVPAAVGCQLHHAIFLQIPLSQPWWRLAICGLRGNAWRVNVARL